MNQHGRPPEVQGEEQAHQFLESWEEVGYPSREAAAKWAAWDMAQDGVLEPCPTEHDRFRRAYIGALLEEQA